MNGWKEEGWRKGDGWMEGRGKEEGKGDGGRDGRGIEGQSRDGGGKRDERKEEGWRKEDGWMEGRGMSNGSSSPFVRRGPWSPFVLVSARLVLIVILAMGGPWVVGGDGAHSSM